MRTWLILAASAALLAPAAQAQDYCASARPHRQLVLKATETLTSGDSDGGTYFSTSRAGCNRYILDVKVETGGSDQVRLNSGALGLSGGKTTTGGFALPASKADCESYSQIVGVYSKGARATQFTRLSQSSVRGTWNGSSCTLTLPSFGPYTSGPTYRIAVGVKVGDAWRQVRGTVLHIPS
jgi:hypothetical protein